MPIDNLTSHVSKQRQLNGFLYLPNMAFRALVSRPWLLGYILVIQAVFQGVIIAHWGLVGNILTLVFVSLFLVAVFFHTKNPRGLVIAVLGTRTQQLAALFVLSLAITMLWGNHSLPAFLSLGQKITFLLIMAAVIDTMRNKERLSSFSWTILGASALLYIIILIEYYIGLDLTLLSENRYVTQDFCERKINILRMHRMTIDDAYGTNRLAYYSILPVASGMGLIFTSTRLLPKLVAAVLVTIVIFWVILSGSRSGTLAILITFLSFILINIRSWRHVVGYIIASSAILGSVLLLLWLLPVGVTSLERIFENDSLSRMLSGHVLNIGICNKDAQVTAAKPVTSEVPGTVINVRSKFKKGITVDERRVRNWNIAIEVFLDNPLGGSGFRTSTDEVLVRIPDARITDPHSGYLMVLSEAGLLGTLPMAAFLLCSLVLLLRTLPGISGRTIIWKTAFLSALFGMLAANLTASYLFERQLWIVLSFAAVIEIWKRENSTGNQTI